jgi:hypothetical protein
MYFLPGIGIELIFNAIVPHLCKDVHVVCSEKLDFAAGMA